MRFIVNILGISGTPRAGGNSEILLQFALQPFVDTGCNVKHYKVRDFNIQPCIACDYCRSHSKCQFDDDMHIFYDAFEWCNAIIISSPVYSRNICSQLLSVMDRHYCVNIKRPLSGKAGAAIAVGRGTCGGQTITINAIYNWLLSCGSICVPGELNGLTAVADKPGDILKQENRLKQATILGQNVLYVTQKLLT
jgi:multimeric flavodoxin WrbA